MRTCLKHFVLATLLCADWVLAVETDQPCTLTNTHQVLSLSAKDAAQGREAKLLATVVDQALPHGQALIVADESGGIYVHSLTNILATFQRNDFLEISGVSSSGEFAPCVIVSSVRKLGCAPPPKARLATYGQLITGALDAQSVEVLGVVRRIWQGAESNIWHMRLAMDGGIVPVRLSIPKISEIKVDAEVRLQAVCFYQFNQKRQLLSPVLQVSTGMLLRVEKKSPDDLYARPSRPLSSLLQYSTSDSPNHSIHVRGIVTRAQSGSYAWIRDETSSLRIQSVQNEILRPGDWINAVGFQKFGSYPPVLEDAIFRKTAESIPPSPVRIEKLEAVYNHDDDLISLDARLVSLRPASDGMLLTLEKEGANFNVIVKGVEASKLDGAWPLQSTLRVAGICSVQYEEPSATLGVRHAESFNILATSPADIVVLKNSPWRNARTIMGILAGATALSLVAAGTVTLLARRRLRDQSLRRMMAEKEFAAILAERNRLAREIHDTLAQGLTATLVQLRLLKKQLAGCPEPVWGSLNATESSIRGSLHEARASIWNMRSQALETGDLRAALQNILRQMTQGAGIETSLEVSGNARRLAPVLENNILRLCQEAITNSVKHADPQSIRVHLEFGERSLLLSVSDDGKGFEVTRQMPHPNGFGLIAMSERAAELKAELKLETCRGHGTVVEVEVPLTGF